MLHLITTAVRQHSLKNHLQDFFGCRQNCSPGCDSSIGLPMSRFVTARDEFPRPCSLLMHTVSEQELQWGWPGNEAKLLMRNANSWDVCVCSAMPYRFCLPWKLWWGCSFVWLLLGLNRSLGTRGSWDYADPWSQSNILSKYGGPKRLKVPKVHSKWDHMDSTSFIPKPRPHTWEWGQDSAD